MKKIFISMLALFAIATTARAQNSINGHEYVDLGLPSGLLWATCNVGADKPEAYGDHFAWGETEKKDNYSWETYKWGTENALTKYTGSDKTVLDPEDDAATANWGGKWRMPTFAEIKELLDNTTNEWTTLNGVKGRKFTAKNGSGNFIFLPASGYRDGGSLDDVGSSGYCWSSSIHESNPAHAYDLYFYSGDAGWNGDARFFGFSVRPVISKGDISTGIEANSSETITNNDWYSIDGKRLQGEPTEKGVYINNGKKVIKEFP